MQQWMVCRIIAFDYCWNKKIVSEVVQMYGCLKNYHFPSPVSSATKYWSTPIFRVRPSVADLPDQLKRTNSNEFYIPFRVGIHLVIFTQNQSFGQRSQIDARYYL